MKARQLHFEFLNERGSQYDPGTRFLVASIVMFTLLVVILRLDIDGPIKAGFTLGLGLPATVVGWAWFMNRVVYKY